MDKTTKWFTLNAVGEARDALSKVFGTGTANLTFKDKNIEKMFYKLNDLWIYIEEMRTDEKTCE